MGKVIMSGIVPPLVAPISGILASDLAVGSVVKLMENGVATEYLIVNQGKPSESSLYDDSCDGLWLLRKDIKEFRQWNSSNVNDYQNSTIHAWLNGDFINQFGAVEQSTIKEVKIPYVNGTGSSPVASGTNGLSTKIFLLSCYEVGLTTNDISNLSVDGAKLGYFNYGTSTSANNKRIAKRNGYANSWWLRSPYRANSVYMWIVGNSGEIGYGDSNKNHYARPALILPLNALFDTNTMLLKGVA